jgi:phosphatidylinositol alpha-1,6-mannosyltransferase
MALVGAGEWDVTCVAPERYRADHGWADFRELPAEPCRALGVRAFGTRSPHLFAYGPALRELLAESWDVVFAWEEPYVVAGAQIASWTRKSSTFTFLTFQNIRKRYPPPFSWMERYTLRRSGGWLYSGHSVYDVQRAEPGYRDRPGELGPLGVDLKLFRPDPEARRRVHDALGWSREGPPVIGYVGRFVPEKGLRFLLRVLERSEEPWRVLFLGNGVLDAELKAWSAKQGDRARVVSAPHDRVADYVNAMDVLCAPSETARHWREQFGRMIIEAFACGVPVIGSDSGEIPHVVGNAGLVAPERDEGAWLRAVTELLASRERRRELSERGLARAQAVYAWPVVARKYLDFFEKIRGR